MKRSVIIVIVLVLVFGILIGGANMTGFSITGYSIFDGIDFWNAVSVERSVERLDKQNILVTLDFNLKDDGENAAGIQEVVGMPPCSEIYDISDGGSLKFYNVMEWLFVDSSLELDAEVLESKQVSYKIRFEPCANDMYDATVLLGGEESVSDGDDYSITGNVVAGGDWCGGADINQDGIVDKDDLIILNNNYKKKNCKAPYWCNLADINQDGEVNQDDFNFLAKSYGLTGCDGIGVDVPAPEPEPEPSPPEPEPECVVDSDCGEDVYGELENFCNEGDVYQKRNVVDYSCVSEVCESELKIEEEFVEACEDGCGGGVCLEVEEEPKKILEGETAGLQINFKGEWLTGDDSGKIKGDDEIVMGLDKWLWEVEDE